MPLYLDEIYFDAPGKDGFKNLHDLIGSALKDGLPPSVTLKAGPFISNEEAKVIVVLDIPDHSTTFGVFSDVVGKGLAAKATYADRRLGLFRQDHEGSQIGLGGSEIGGKLAKFANSILADRTKVRGQVSNRTEDVSYRFNCVFSAA